MGQQVLVDELGAVVRIDAEDGEGKRRSDVLKGLEDPFGGFVPHGPVHRPPGRDVGHGQGEAELPEAVSAFVADQIDLHKPWDRVVPLGPGPDGDLGFQQRAGLGVGPAPREQFRPFAGELPVDRRRAHAHQQLGLPVGDLKFFVAA
jgi:hypothetical protein